MNQVKTLLEFAVQQRIGSGMAASFGALDQVAAWPELYLGTESHLPYSNQISPDTIFDLASLTKILSTTTVYMQLHEAGKVDVHAPLSDYLPEETKRYPHLAGITLCKLLSHTSGLPAWSPFYEKMRERFGSNLPYVSIQERRDYFFDLVFSTPLENEPGTKTVYSDLGFLILGYLAEKLLDASLSSILTPGLDYRPVVMDAEGERFRISKTNESIAMTELCPWRGLLQGQVHDDNCWSMGGIAGHAGGFGTLQAVKAWVSDLLNGQLVSLATLRKFASETPLITGLPSGRALGFDLPARDGSGSTGFAFSSKSIGHLGFTGTSLWLDLDQGFGAVLLTNRVHPDRNDNRIRLLRRAFHTEVAQS